ncbi:hypothetical protein J437_LFUL017544 [Ladona fulva]|uniref:Uncharacterized protein n=1 Tax=Ladona fulva TaxID=123851 RepID=A0A8K0KQC4_LADFU|nr:hypothetical protein J437_LFUL017544 [Ladona fulva]
MVLFVISVKLDKLKCSIKVILQFISTLRMPSEKRVNKKKSHRRKGKKYSRSSEGKDEGKKSRNSKNRLEDQVSEIDICSYVNDSAELVSKIFTCLGESYLAEATPPIFKSLRQIELKKLCLRELAMLSSEAVLGIMHG